jgi:hypothetical protein
LVSPFKVKYSNYLKDELSTLPQIMGGWLAAALVVIWLGTQTHL